MLHGAIVAVTRSLVNDNKRYHTQSNSHSDRCHIFSEHYHTNTAILKTKTLCSTLVFD